MPRPRPATLAGCGAIALWSFFALVARFIHRVPPLEMTAIGFGVASVAGLIVLAMGRRLHELQQPPVAWLHGVGGLFGFHALYFAALALAPPTQATVINYSWPLLTVLLSAAVMGFALRISHVLGLVLGFMGCVLLLRQDAVIDLSALPGYVCALAGALVWATYSAFARKLTAVPTGAMVGFYGVTAILSGAGHLMFERPVWPDATSWLAMSLLGLGPMGLAFMLWDFGIKRGDPKLLGVLGYVTPIASYLLLCLGGFAPFGPGSIVAATLVGVGGLLAGRD